jgi:hypothetical protein
LTAGSTNARRSTIFRPPCRRRNQTWSARRIPYNFDFLGLGDAARGLIQPMAVADYILTRAVPQDLKGALPTIEEIEEELADFEKG